MSDIDDYISQQVIPLLRQDEILWETGWLEWGDGQDNHFLLAAATTQRLVLMETTPSMSSLTPRLAKECRWRSIIELAALERLDLIDFGGTPRLRLRVASPPADRLWNALGAGPLDVMVRANGMGLDGQIELHRRLGPWLDHHFKAGSFRTPQGMAVIRAEMLHYVQQRDAARAALAQTRAEEDRRRAQAADLARRKSPVVWPYLVAVLPALFGLLGAFNTLVTSSAHHEQQLAYTKKAIAAAKAKPESKRSYDESDLAKNGAARIRRIEQNIEDVDASRLRWAILMVLGLGGAGGLIVTGRALGRKKRAAFDAWQAGQGAQGGAPVAG